MRGHGYAARDRERYIEFARRATEPSVTALGLPDMQQASQLVNAADRRRRLIHRRRKVMIPVEPPTHPAPVLTFAVTGDS